VDQAAPVIELAAADGHRRRLISGRAGATCGRAESAERRAEEKATDLNAGLGEVDAHGDLFSRVNVRVVRLLESAFQLLWVVPETKEAKRSVGCDSRAVGGREMEGVEVGGKGSKSTAK